MEVPRHLVAGVPHEECRAVRLDRARSTGRLGYAAFLPASRDAHVSVACCWQDRGVPERPGTSSAVQAHGGAFLVRLTRNYDPWVSHGVRWTRRRSTVPPGIRPSSGSVSPPNGPRARWTSTSVKRATAVWTIAVGFRVVAVPGRDPTMSAALHTICRARTAFSPALVSATLKGFVRHVQIAVVLIEGVEQVRDANLHKWRLASESDTIAEGTTDLRRDRLCSRTILKRFRGACRAVRRSTALDRVDAARGHVTSWHILGRRWSGRHPAGRRPCGLRPATRTCLPASRTLDGPTCLVEHRTGRLRAGLELVVPA